VNQIQLKGLVKVYNNFAGKVVALNGIELAVVRGEFLVVTGKSGAGKTTLVNMIAGLAPLTSGEIWVNGTAVHQLDLEQLARWRGHNVGVVFQSFELLPSLTVLQNVTLPMDFAARYSEKVRRERAMHLLDQLGIADHAQKRPSAVSGGQQQRVAIARALANDPPLIIADEPTGSLDTNTARAILDLFEQLVVAGKTLLIVTHDLDIQRRATRAVELVDGRLYS
jgi:putative ABC transport system ATP-binding protein